MEFAESFEEMVSQGKQFLLDYPECYPENYIQKNMAKFGEFVEDKDELRSLLHAGAYCQRIYGTSLLEFATFHFAEKSHAERKQYVTWESRFIYTAFLNKNRDTHLLDNKYEAYTLLKPFYKREAMLLSSENDYNQFCSFVKRNPAIFVKPNNLELAEGVHRLSFSDDGNLRTTFNLLLKEAADLSSTEIKREIDHRLILEELIRPSAFIRQLNPDELSLLRVTTINIKGKVHFFYPCLRLLVGDGKGKTGEDYSYDALIDSDSGEVVTNGKHSLGDIDLNPVTGQRIQGIRMPDWEELKEMLVKAAEMLPTIRYIGWDVTHTDRGWCIIEGNPNGEFFYQMCTGHGLKDELEDLIGFKVPYDFWKSPFLRKSTTRTQEKVSCQSPNV